MAYIADEESKNMFVEESVDRCAKATTKVESYASDTKPLIGPASKVGAVHLHLHEKNHMLVIDVLKHSHANTSFSFTQNSSQAQEGKCYICNDTHFEYNCQLLKHKQLHCVNKDDNHVCHFCGDIFPAHGNLYKDYAEHFDIMCS